MSARDDKGGHDDLVQSLHGVEGRQQFAHTLVKCSLWHLLDTPTMHMLYWLHDLHCLYILQRR